jgi:hypothetical protein
MERPASQRFPIRLGRRSKPILLLFGARESNAYVDVSDVLHARFGFYGLSTPVSNISGWRIEGPWSWFTAIGVRRGIRDGVASYGGNHHAGVRVDFKERVRWLRILHTPALYVTVADLEGFAAALTARGIPGSDARKPR